MINNIICECNLLSFFVSSLCFNWLHRTYHAILESRKRKETIHKCSRKFNDDRNKETYFLKYHTFNKKKHCYMKLNPLSVNHTKWSNTPKQSVGCKPTNCLSVFDHFAGLALKGLTQYKELSDFDLISILQKILFMDYLSQIKPYKKLYFPFLFFCLSSSHSCLEKCPSANIDTFYCVIILWDSELAHSTSGKELNPSSQGKACFSGGCTLAY